ncbi:MAG: class I SAM-dependent methyltransferase [Bacteroidota bacterium]
MPQSTTTKPALKSEQIRAMKSYYHFHAKIYDLTRWSFLFGRHQIIHDLGKSDIKPKKILEVGCGTGYNTRLLIEQFPEAHLLALDVSAEMLEKAIAKTAQLSPKVEFINQPYTFGDTTYHKQLDIILFSYSLTMINPQWESLIIQASRDLKPGGIIAVVDFHNAPFQWFKSHMQNNHVRMEGHILPVLQRRFISIKEQIHPAYGGIWKYFTFMGMKAY